MDMPFGVWPEWTPSLKLARLAHLVVEFLMTLRRRWTTSAGISALRETHRGD